MWLHEKYLTTENSLHHYMGEFWYTVAVANDLLLLCDSRDGFIKTTPTFKTFRISCE